MVAVSEYGAVLAEVDAVADPDFHGFVVEYVYSALRLSVAFQRLGRLDEAYEWSGIAVNNGELLFAEHRLEERTIRSDRRALLGQHLSVCSELGRDEEAAKYTLQLSMLD